VAFLGGLGVHLISLSFYLTLTLMLSTVSSSRGLVIGIPLLIALGQQFLLGRFPALFRVLPWTLTIPPNNGNYPSVAMAVVIGARPLSYLPVATSLGAAVLFVAIALWSFSRKEL
jgi:hypothetical protein